MLETLVSVKDTNMVFAKAYLPEHHHVMLWRDNEHYVLIGRPAASLIFQKI